MEFRISGKLNKKIDIALVDDCTVLQANVIVEQINKLCTTIMVFTLPNILSVTPFSMSIFVSMLTRSYKINNFTYSIVRRYYNIST